MYTKNGSVRGVQLAMQTLMVCPWVKYHQCLWEPKPEGRILWAKLSLTGIVSLGENRWLRHLDLHWLFRPQSYIPLCLLQAHETSSADYLLCHSSVSRRIRCSPAHITTIYSYTFHGKPMIGILIRHILRSYARVSLSLEQHLISVITKLISWAPKPRATPHPMASPWCKWPFLGPLKIASGLSLCHASVLGPHTCILLNSFHGTEFSMTPIESHHRCFSELYLYAFSTISCSSL